MKQIILIGLCALLTVPSESWAHKVVMSAYIIGWQVEGEVGFSSGSMAENATVEVFSANGQKLAEVQSDEEGFFTYRPAQAQDLKFRADLGAGHVGEALVKAADFPALMAPLSSAEARKGRQQAPQAPFQATVTASRLQKLSSEVRALRKEIEAAKNQQSFRDVMGGIGFILGIVGVAAYCLSRQKAGG